MFRTTVIISKYPKTMGSSLVTSNSDFQYLGTKFLVYSKHQKNNRQEEFFCCIKV